MTVHPYELKPMDWTPTMDPTIKAQWVEALRSGEYKQGKSKLHLVEENTYCCLGVLCELAVKAGVTTSQVVSLPGYGPVTFYGPEGSRRDDLLPRDVMEWAGIGKAAPAVPTEANPNYYIKLSHRNDTDDWDFTAIANVIEQFL